LSSRGAFRKATWRTSCENAQLVIWYNADTLFLDCHVGRRPPRNDTEGEAAVAPLPSQRRRSGPCHKGIPLLAMTILAVSSHKIQSFMSTAVIATSAAGLRNDKCGEARILFRHFQDQHRYDQEYDLPYRRYQFGDT
jgi:hypothetical protein